MYALLKLVHVTSVVLTVGGFVLRGYWMATSSALLHHRWTRVLPHVVDSVLLVSGVAMLYVLSLNPFRIDWLLAKFAGLAVYIVLGTLALKRGRTRQARMLALAAALLVFAYIVGVALSRSPASWLPG